MKAQPRMIMIFQVDVNALNDQNLQPSQLLTNQLGQNGGLQGIQAQCSSISTSATYQAYASRVVRGVVFQAFQKGPNVQ